jgi:agmatine deiminase
MITDEETNVLYLADSLPKLQVSFFPRFKKVLGDLNLSFEFMPGTKDIWAVDYMPIQVHQDKFVQFTYDPDYLQKKEYKKTISDVDAICNKMKLETHKSNLVVDGGNVVKGKDKVILCDKVFQENKHLSERELIAQLEALLEVSKIIFVPWDPWDFTGHADGMVRFVNDDMVLINDYGKEDKAFQRCFRMALHNAGLDWIELPYQPTTDPKSISAEGLYLNYLHLNGTLVVPTFNNDHDERAVWTLKQVFPNHTIATIECNDLAAEGGLLNCITWNILK